MTDAAVQQMLDDLFSALEALETQTGAILEFLKDRGIAREEDLAPYWEKAANASNVRWRATRIRINHLLLSPPKADDISQEKFPQSTETKKDQPAIGQPAEEPGDSADQERPAKRTEEDLKDQKDGARQAKDANSKLDRSATNAPASKDVS